MNLNKILFKSYDEEVRIERQEEEPLILKRRNRSLQFSAAVIGNFKMLFQTAKYLKEYN